MTTPNADRTTVVGVFNNRSDADQAVQALRQAGFREDQIGFLMRGQEGQQGGDSGTNAGEGAASGALTGGILGGLLAAAGALLIPGFGPVIAGGLLASVLGGAAVGAAAGGILGALTGLGVPEDEARFYESEVQSGNILVTVKADNRYNEAASILQRFGGRNSGNRGATQTAGMAGTAGVAATAATRTAGTTGEQHAHPHAHSSGEQHTHPHTPDHEHADAQTRAVNTTGGATRNTQGEQTVQVREERLQVNKEAVQAGEVQIRKEVVTEQQTINVPVSREEIVIERRNVTDRPSDRPIAEGAETDTVRIPLREERVHVEKTPVVTEEVSIGKRVVTENEQVTESVRKEQVRLEQEGDVNIRNAGTDVNRTTDRNAGTDATRNTNRNQDNNPRR